MTKNVFESIKYRIEKLNKILSVLENERDRIINLTYSRNPVYSVRPHIYLNNLEDEIKNTKKEIKELKQQI
jgi:hypothetical protein